MTDNERADCKECADEHKQLAEWLKELKQFKEQEFCEDVVSREEAIRVLKENCSHWDTNVMLIDIATDLLKKLPSVTPTQKKGKWEQYGDFWKEKYRCSECKEEQLKILCGEQIIRLWSNYCPHCGAKMQEVEE